MRLPTGFLALILHMQLAQPGRSVLLGKLQQLKEISTGM
jgi:hypothetical protein